MTAVIGMEQTINGWEISKSSYDSTIINQLSSKIGEGYFKDINSIVAIKKGKLLLEEYYNKTKREDLHDTRSVGKTFASALAGIAIDQGYIEGVNCPLSDFYTSPHLRETSLAASDISLYHLLTMSSGIDGDDNDSTTPGNEGKMYPQSNWVKWMLELPMSRDRKPGEKWTYLTAGVVLLGDILDKKVPGGLERFAHQELFEPIGIKEYQWEYTPQGVPNTAGGLRMAPLDYAKFGQLYLNDGCWEERVVIPSSWVKDSFTDYFSTTLEGNDYGYLWWSKYYYLGGQKLKAYYAGGNGGNKIFVFPQYDIVIVVTASAYGRDYAHTQVDEIMEHYVLPAIMSS